MDLKTKAINLHRRYQGKLETASKIPLRNLKDLSLIYTPGVGAVSSLIAKNKNQAQKLTWKGNAIAGLIKKPNSRHIIPSIFDKRLMKIVAKAIY